MSVSALNRGEIALETSGTMEFTQFSYSFLLSITQVQEDSDRQEQKEYWLGALGPRDGTEARSWVFCLIYTSRLKLKMQPRIANRR